MSREETPEDFVCRKCGSGSIRSIEQGAADAAVDLCAGKDGRPRVEDFPDGVDTGNAEWDTVGFYCVGCGETVNTEDGHEELSDLVVTRAEYDRERRKQSRRRAPRKQSRAKGGAS